MVTEPEVEKLDPRSVMVVPPVVGPVLGSIELIDGAL